MELDRFDRQLLHLVQQDSAQTAERLAEQVPLSPSAIQRRLKKLRENGVILRDTAIVDPAAAGRPTLYLVSLEVETERPELQKPLHQWLAAEECIQQAFYVTGQADYRLIVSAPDTQTFDAIMERLVRDNPHVKRFSTNVALKIIKQSLALPLL
ncbi:Lrp/AsnC family transcriptional regulator [Bowmanella dokdonensis]|uniref:Lrp/AsnC family transcriptional regulator n=1 Tax=Bowmanella dokdonensis TaxID=751969 RepID=A0A939DPR1_9ALTE|nr:Lrp/AsnC family transcriptional regulator [Bowmanella dokdonensis]MBN7825686.1 Lrp/AsnC family transcriptional regulator [Bowmanella dokdonensis]